MISLNYFEIKNVRVLYFLWLSIFIVFSNFSLSKPTFRTENKNVFLTLFTNLPLKQHSRFLADDDTEI